MAVIDGDYSFDPAWAQKAGSELGRVLWVHCGHRMDTAQKATDMILHSGGIRVDCARSAGVSSRFTPLS